MRKPDVAIKGVLWDQATIFCSEGCGNVLFLGRKPKKRKR